MWACKNGHKDVVKFLWPLPISPLVTFHRVYQTRLFEAITSTLTSKQFEVKNKTILAASFVRKWTLSELWDAVGIARFRLFAYFSLTLLQHPKYSTICIWFYVYCLCLQKSNSLTDYLWSFDVTKVFRSLELVLIASIWAILLPSIGTLSPKVSRLLPSASVLVEIMVTMVTNPLATLKVLSVRDKQCLKKTENT